MERGAVHILRFDVVQMLTRGGCALRYRATSWASGMCEWRSPFPMQVRFSHIKAAPGAYFLERWPAHCRFQDEGDEGGSQEGPWKLLTRRLERGYASKATLMIVSPHISAMP